MADTSSIRRMPPGAHSRIVLLSFLPYFAISVVHVVALAAQSPIAGPTKLALMPLLALPVLVAAPRLRPRVTIALLLTAIVFSWLGDGAGTLFLVDDELPLMLLFFGIAHLAYIALFWRYLRIRRSFPWWALVYAAWWIGMLAYLWPALGVLLVPVAVYGLVLGGTAALAARCHPLIAVGGAFFLLSDTVLALRLFLVAPLPHWTSPVVIITYTLGQGLLIAGALLALRKTDAAT